MYLVNGDTLEAVTGSAATCDMVTEWGEGLISGVPGQSFPIASTRSDGVAAATTTLVADVGDATKFRFVQRLSITNRHATTATLLTIRIKAGATIIDQFEVTLAAKEKIEWKKERGVWDWYAADGSLKVTNVLPVATQADMEAGSSNALVVTPANLGWHPSSVKAWLNCGLTGNILASYNITSVADTGTGRATVTIATDFSSANYARVATIDFNSTTLAQSCTISSPAAGTLVLESVVEAGSSADPVSAWSLVCLGDQ